MTAAAYARLSVRGTNLGYASLAEWLALVYSIGGRIQASRSHYRRCRQLYRSLRAGDVPCGWGLQRELTRSEIGALLVETRNRLGALRGGRADRPRSKGLRFDPARIPDAALERLIQRHLDLETADHLRAERIRRLAQRRPSLSP